MRYYIWDKQAGGLVRNTAPQSFDSFEDARRHIERSPREEWPRFSVFPTPQRFLIPVQPGVVLSLVTARSYGPPRRGGVRPRRWNRVEIRRHFWST